MKNLLIILSLSVLSLSKLSAQQPTQADTMQGVTADSLQTMPVETAVAASEPASAPKEKKPMAKPEKRFKYGARAGVSSSFLSSNPRDYSVNSQIGFNAGVYLRIYLFKRLYIQPEINYYFNSYEFTRTVAGPDFGKEDKVKTHYLQIPILAGYQLFDKKKFGLQVQTGPSIGINVGVSDNDVGVSRDDFNTTYWSWIVDGQLRIGRITVQGGFVAGMSDYVGNSRNHSWYVGMGFSL